MSRIMADFNFAHAPGLNVPDEFLPAIGLVMVQHAYMDRELKSAICRLAGLDHNAGISILLRLQNTKARSDVFRNLAVTQTNELSMRRKLEVMCNVIGELCAERNTIAHVIPYWWSPSTGELGYFKDGNFTFPQLQGRPPYVASIESLYDLARRMSEVGIWLSMLAPSWSADSNISDASKSHHPHWNDDAMFPWKDRLKEENTSK